MYVLSKLYTDAPRLVYRTNKKSHKTNKGRRKKMAYADTKLYRSQMRAKPTINKKRKKSRNWGLTKAYLKYDRNQYNKIGQGMAMSLLTKQNLPRFLGFMSYIPLRLKL